jgi:hypothetical protein
VAQPKAAVVVYGMRAKRKGESWFKKTTARSSTARCAE